MKPRQRRRRNAKKREKKKWRAAAAVFKDLTHALGALEKTVRGTAAALAGE